MGIRNSTSHDACRRVGHRRHRLGTAAASSMGVACIQLAKLAGASTVIALTRSAAKHPALIEAGADAVVDHRDQGAADEIRKLVPEMGVDVVFDNHGGQELLDFSMDVLDLGGRYVLISSEATSFGNSLGIDLLAIDRQAHFAAGSPISDPPRPGDRRASRRKKGRSRCRWPKWFHSPKWLGRTSYKSGVLTSARFLWLYS